MLRNVTIFNAVTAAFLMISLTAEAQAATQTERHVAVRAIGLPDAGKGTAALATSGKVPGKAVETTPEPPLVLSPREAEVSQIAEHNGDRQFLMVDKTLGKIIIFDNGKPVLSGAALTGASPLDRFGPGVLAKPDSAKFTTQEKVTPAGRFTVTRTYDNELGVAFEINEVHGKDWWLAIHHVYLGIPSEHREQRIQSGDPQEEHITFGCINVSAEAIRYLALHLPKHGKTPLYVLPTDEALTSTFFAPRVSVSALTRQAM